MSSFKVQDVVYVALEKKLQILPARVAEKVTKEDSSGTSILLSLEFPGVEELQTVNADNNVFGSLEAARAELINRITNSIDKMCEHAQKIRDTAFEGVNEPQVVVQSEETDDATMVEMPDGTVARVKLPDNF